MDQTRSRERLGFLCAGTFVVIASMRDVYFAAMFQTYSPLHVAVIAFTLCTVVFLAVALIRRQSLYELRPWLWEVVGINVTSAIAWIAYFYPLRNLEPSLAQTLWAGIGPLSVMAVEASGIGLAKPAAVGPAERLCHLGILGALVLGTLVVAAGLSGAPTHAQARPMLGAFLALLSGASISINVLLCKRLNERRVGPAMILTVRFVGVLIVAAVLAVVFGDTAVGGWSPGKLGMVAASAILLLVAPIYVNQLGIALAPAMTVRGAMALGPVLVFVLQLYEGRLRASGYSLAVIVLYSIFAILAAVARQWPGSSVRLRRLAWRGAVTLPLTGRVGERSEPGWGGVLARVGCVAEPPRPPALPLPAGQAPR
jgi:drug/metabolite transporter (DMT)-like permease